MNLSHIAQIQQLEAIGELFGDSVEATGLGSEQESETSKTQKEFNAMRLRKWPFDILC